MKIALAFLAGVALTLAATLAQDGQRISFRTSDGREFKNVTLGTATPDSISVETDSGMERVPLASLPAELQERFKYDAAKATEFLKAQRDAHAVAERAKMESIAAKQKAAAVQAKSQRLRIEVLQSVDGGVVVVPYFAHALGSSNGMDGSNAIDFRRSTKTVFIKGLSGLADGESSEIVAYRDGIWTREDVLGTERNLERWIFVKAWK